MDTKQMSVANVNLVFGPNEEPLIRRVDDIVLPALQSGFVREGSKKTKYFFENVCIREISEDVWVLQGLIIKDTVLDVMSEYSATEGLTQTEKHIKSAPYSLFILYLKNHRMLLVKNQQGSPDVRAFSSTLKSVISEFVRSHNELAGGNGKSFKRLYPSLSVTGIKTAANVKETLKDVEKINELVLKFYPLNAEWDYNPVFGAIDQQVRKKIQSKKGRMIFRSPKSIDGVAELIEETEGMVKSEMKVTYKHNSNASDRGSQRTGTIKDDQVSDVMSIELTKELDNAYDEVNNIGKDINALKVASRNQIIDYQEYLKKQKQRNK